MLKNRRSAWWKNAPERTSIRRRAMAGVAIAFVILAAAICSGQLYERKNSRGQESHGNLAERFSSASIIHKGNTFRLNKNLTTILFIGVDRSFSANAIGARNGGQADFLLLMIIDSTNKVIKRLSIDRDTMAPVTVLGVLGNNVGTKTMQICLSHGFGDGKEQSCRFTLEAVQRLLGGVPLDYYIAMDLDGIGVLNDALGGVTVPIKDDFSAFDAAMTPGTTMKLTGQQAEWFVRQRMGIGDGTNESRMARQRLYLDKAIGVLMQRAHADIDSIGQLFDALEGYLVTNMNRGRILNEAYQARSCAEGDAPVIEGSHVIGEDGFVEFRPDQDKLTDLIVNEFYKPAT